MGAIDYWIQASKRPSCLMAVTPYRGGAWLSPMRAGVAYPSEILRNFATEPATWYDFQRWCEENIVVTDDQQFEITFYRNIDGLSDETERYFNPSSGVGAVSVSYIPSGYLGVLFGAQASLPGQTKYFLSPSSTPLSSGPHTIKVSYIGNQIHGWLDGVSELAVSHDRGTELRNSVPISDFDGNIISMSFTNLTTGESWSYPTWAEEKRLLTYTNVRTDRGVFEAADVSRKWGAATQLDLRGRPARLTMVAKCYIPPLLTSGTIDVYNLVAQGSAETFTNAVCNFGIYVYQTELTLLAGFDTGVTAVYHVPGSNADAEHVIACVIDYDARQSRMYLDGVMLEQRNNPSMPSTFPTSTVYPVVTLQNSVYNNQSGSYALSISHAQIHDYAMTAAEIAQFK